MGIPSSGVAALVRAAAKVAVVGALAGCAGGARSAPSELDGLRERVVALEGERRRQASRLDALTARLTALEGRSTRSPRARRDLPVVRVRSDAVRQREGATARPAAPTGEDEGVVYSEAWQAARAGGADEDAEGGERPVLRLEGSRRAAAESGTRRQPSRSIELAAVTERLPVVPMPAEPPVALPGPALEPGLAEEGPAPAAPVDEVVREARRQVGAGECGPALESLARILVESPEHQLADDAMLLRAQCMRRQGAHLRAIGELERMARRYPRGDRRADGLLLTAESYAAIGDRERARELFGQLMREHPRSSAASRATARVQELSRGSRAPEEP